MRIPSDANEITQEELNHLHAMTQIARVGRIHTHARLKTARAQVRIMREALESVLDYAEPWAIDEQREFRESIAAARAALEATKEET